MSKSPGRNNPNNTVAIVARPGLRPAPTHTVHSAFDSLPSAQISQWIKMKTQKWTDMERGRECLGAEGRKTKCIGQDQLGISSSLVPTHWLVAPHLFHARSIQWQKDRGKTTQTLNDFMIYSGMVVHAMDESWAGVCVVGVLAMEEETVCLDKSFLLDRLARSRSN